MASNDPAVFQEFREALGTRDPKTIATYLTTLRHFVVWLAAQPGGTAFHLVVSDPRYEPDLPDHLSTCPPI